MRLNFFFGRLQKKIMTSSSGWDSPNGPSKESRGQVSQQEIRDRGRDRGYTQCTFAHV